eukprot:scaffold298_cov247-Pinguiococcus_pyrenoidosus.AAC.11
MRSSNHSERRASGACVFTSPCSSLSSILSLALARSVRSLVNAFVSSSRTAGNSKYRADRRNQISLKRRKAMQNTSRSCCRSEEKRREEETGEQESRGQVCQLHQNMRALHGEVGWTRARTCGFSTAPAVPILSLEFP